MIQITPLSKRYDTDLKNFLSWFDYEIKTNQKLNKAIFFLNRVLYTIRETQGLEENTEFIKDIYNSENLSVHSINIYCISPGHRTKPMVFKDRQIAFRLGIDKIFDDSIETRKCVLCIPSKNNAYIEYIDESEKVNDDTIDNDFKISTTIEMGDYPFIMPVDTPFYFNNNSGTEPLYMLHVAFECNPTIDSVIDQML
jgi:hypothetical protein